MNFDIYGPYEVPRSDGLVDNAPASKRSFWKGVDELVPGLPEACGCYIFVLKATNGTRPWYVGLTTKATFKDETLKAFQLVKYNQAMNRKARVKPMLILLAKRTPGGRFAKPKKNRQRDVEFLETFLIGLALNRNSRLLNSKNTKHLKNLVAPGVINSPKGRPGKPVLEIKKVLWPNS